MNLIAWDPRICVEADAKKVKPRPVSFPCDSIHIDRTYTLSYIYIYIYILLNFPHFENVVGTGEEGTVIQRKCGIHECLSCGGEDFLSVFSVEFLASETFSVLDWNKQKP